MYIAIKSFKLENTSCKLTRNIEDLKKKYIYTVFISFKLESTSCKPVRNIEDIIYIYKYRYI